MIPLPALRPLGARFYFIPLTFLQFHKLPGTVPLEAVLLPGTLPSQITTRLASPPSLWSRLRCHLLSEVFLEDHVGKQTKGPPQNVHILISRTYECVPICGNRDFADVSKLRILRWGDHSRSRRRAQCDHMGLYKWKRETEGSERLGMRSIQPTGAGFEGGGRGPQTRNRYGQCPRAGKGKDTDSSPRTTRRNTVLPARWF